MEFASHFYCRTDIQTFEEVLLGKMEQEGKGRKGYCRLAMKQH